MLVIIALYAESYCWRPQAERLFTSLVWKINSRNLAGKINEKGNLLKFSKKMRGEGFEPTNTCVTGPSSLRL